MASLPGSARLLRALVVAACLFPVIQACGRSEPGDYLYNADGTISQGASSNTSAGRSSTGGTRNGAAGANGTGANGTGANGTGANGTGATTGVGGRGPIGVGGTIAVGGTGTFPEGGEAGTGVGAAAGQGGTGNVTPISCGDEICTAETQSCCAGLAGLACIPKGQSCEGAVLGCTLNADCSGNDICCISITGSIDAASSCKARCDNMGMGRDRQLCQSDDECRMPFRFCTPTIFGVNICTRRP
jgi:hypothetical protein